MKTLTVFTPTFNRAYCLHQCYESLIKQSNQDFVWLIIDDGSTDNTKALVQSWIAEKKIDIQYHYQTNQGMHGAHNAAYRLIETELNTCIDSDDFMPPDAVEKILKHWKTIQNNTKFAGLVGLDADKSGNIIGSKFPEDIKSSTLIELYERYKVAGDKKLVLRTDVVRQYPPYPIFEGERFVPLGNLYLLIDQDYQLYPINEVLCIVEYLQDGSSLNMFKQYKRHPKGFAYSRLAEMKYGPTLLYRFKKAIHYVANSLMAGNKNFVTTSPKPLITIVAFPFGILFYFYILYKTYGSK